MDEVVQQLTTLKRSLDHPGLIELVNFLSKFVVETSSKIPRRIRSDLRYTFSLKSSKGAAQPRKERSAVFSDCEHSEQDKQNLHDLFKALTPATFWILESASSSKRPDPSAGEANGEPESPVSLTCSEDGVPESRLKSFASLLGTCMKAEQDHAHYTLFSRFSYIAITIWKDTLPRGERDCLAKQLRSAGFFQDIEEAKLASTLGDYLRRGSKLVWLCRHMSIGSLYYLPLGIPHSFWATLTKQPLEANEPLRRLVASVGCRPEYDQFVQDVLWQQLQDVVLEPSRIRYYFHPEAAKLELDDRSRLLQGAGNPVELLSRRTQNLEKIQGAATTQNSDQGPALKRRKNGPSTAHESERHQASRGSSTATHIASNTASLSTGSATALPNLLNGSAPISRREDSVTSSDREETRDAPLTTSSQPPTNGVTGFTGTNPASFMDLSQNNEPFNNQRIAFDPHTAHAHPYHLDNLGAHGQVFPVSEREGAHHNDVVAMHGDSSQVDTTNDAWTMMPQHGVNDDSAPSASSDMLQHGQPADPRVNRNITQNHATWVPEIGANFVQTGHDFTTAQKLIAGLDVPRGSVGNALSMQPGIAHGVGHSIDGTMTAQQIQGQGSIEYYSNTGESCDIGLESFSFRSGVLEHPQWPPVYDWTGLQY